MNLNCCLDRFALVQTAVLYDDFSNTKDYTMTVTATNSSEILWTQRYRPNKIEDCVLPEHLKQYFTALRDKGEIPNMILAGHQGTGKTTVARALCAELDADVLEINGSMNGGIDTLRNEIKAFASTVSFGGGRKVVILDEADYLNAQSTQPALRNFMEEFSAGCAFILTCNFKNRLIEPLHSRCTVVDFKINKSDMAALAKTFFTRAGAILDLEGVPYEKPVLAELIKKHFPDWRRVLNELQRYSTNGKIDTGIFANLSDDSFKTLTDALKTKKFKEMRQWVAENLDNEVAGIFRRFYDRAFDLVKPTSVPVLVLLIAEYQHKSAFSMDQEINMAAFFTQCMLELEWL